MKIPSEDDCFKLIKKMEMMDHIIAHSVMVSKVTRFLCSRLMNSSHSIDIRLATRAALLHDITKTRSFQTHEIHSHTGGQLLSDMGYPEIGDIIRQHVLLDTYEEETTICESEIVNYSDKRVLHDKIVPLEERLGYIRERYGSNLKFRDRVNILCEKTLVLESKLFNHLEFHPDQLNEEMQGA